MRAVCQRVREARVEVEGEVVGSIEGGLLVFLGAGEGDTEDDLAWTLRKVVEPPRWLGLALMSVGAVLTVKSLSMRGQV